MRRTVVAGGVAVLAILAFGWWGGTAQQPLQGDQVGPESGETREHYVERAARLAAGELQNAHGKPRFALLSFRYPVTPLQAAVAVEGVARVSAVITTDKGPVAIPEPTAGKTRAEVIATVPGNVTAVVIYDRPEVLWGLASRDGVLAVEPAPADSPWGAFAIRPLG